MAKLLKLLLVAGMVAFPLAAGADVLWDISPGTGAPPRFLGPHFMEPFLDDPRPPYSVVSDVRTPFGSVVGFSPSVEVRVAGGAGWATWSHGYKGDVYYTQGATSLTMTMPEFTPAFYFYAEPNPFEVFTFAATATDGTVSAFVARPVEGYSGAAYFGAYTLTGPPLASITVSSDVDFAVGEFGIGLWCRAPEPSSLALVGLGVLLLGAWRRRF
jgi:hypothetical protein